MSSPFRNEVKERPILFSAEMVKAILEGRKTQTRRIAKFKPRTKDDKLMLCTLGTYNTCDPNSGYVLRSRGGAFGCWSDRTYPLHCPFGQVGDRLWVRENFKVSNVYEGYQSQFVIDDFESPECLVEYDDGSKRKIELEHLEYVQAVRASKKKKSPSIHMPRWASRINLEIIDIRIERLQDITEQDAIAEGCDNSKTNGSKYCGWCETPKRAFCRTWEWLNEKRDYGWKANPFVWVIEFRRINNE